MILYNVTFGIDREIEPEWVQWMKETHIPEVLSTGVFTGHKFYKVLSHEVEGTSSYCIQYFTPSIIQFNQHIDTYCICIHWPKNPLICPASRLTLTHSRSSFAPYFS